MPPRYAYWTILIDGKPTAFRAAKQDELLPTLAQLRRANPVIEMKWFARGKLWDSPEQSQWAGRNAHDLRKAGPPRDREWRPGGEHKDPRARFDKHKKKHRPHDDRPREPDRDRPPVQTKPDVGRPRPDKPRSAPPWKSTQGGPPPGDRPLPGQGGPPRGDRPLPGQGGPPRGDRPLPGQGGPPRGDRPWSGKPAGAGGFRRDERRDRPHQDKPGGGAPKGDRPWRDPSTRPPSFPPRAGSGKRPWVGKPSASAPPRRDKDGPPRSDRPWSGAPKRDKTFDAPKGDRPWQNRPPGAAPKPWREKPAGGPPRGGRPWSGKPSASGTSRRDEGVGGRSGPPRPRDGGHAGPKDGSGDWPARPKPRGGRPFPPKRGGGR